MANLETLLADTRYFADQGSDPSAPSAGEPVAYTKSGQLYLRNSAGIVGPLLDETAHDNLDHTGLTGVGGGGTSLTGQVLIAVPFAVDFGDTSATEATADRAYAMPVAIPGAMSLRELLARVTVGATGTCEWGLFDYSSSAAAATKLAGGSGALNATGWVSIAATSAPVAVGAGNYLLVFHYAAANPPTIRRNGAGGASGPWVKVSSTYTWDDTPDFTSGGGLWGDFAQPLHVLLSGDMDGGNQW